MRVFVALWLLTVVAVALGQGRVLRAGDQIRIVSAEDASLCVTRAIDAQGQIRLPGAGALHLEGLSLDEATRAIARTDRVLVSDVSIVLVAARYRPILVYGSVKNTGELTLTPDMRLSDA